MSEPSGESPEGRASVGLRLAARGYPSVIKNQIKGSASQMVVCQLDQGQTMFCEAGKFLWKTSNVGLETRFTTPEQEEANKGKGLLGKALSSAVEVGQTTTRR